MAVVDREAIRTAARAKLEQRLGVIDDLADAKEEIGAAEEALRAAKQRMQDAASLYTSAYKSALGAGWSSKELKDSGLPSPQRAAEGRKPRAPRARKAASAPAVAV
jgi:hypothetical protein